MFEALSRVAIFLRIRSSGGSLHSAALRLRPHGLTEHPPQAHGVGRGPGTRRGLGADCPPRKPPAPERSVRASELGVLRVQSARRISTTWEEISATILLIFSTY